MSVDVFSTTDSRNEAKNAHVYLKRGHQATGEGRHQDALREYQKYQAATPDHGMPYCLMGGAFAALHRFAEAAASYKQAMEHAHHLGEFKRYELYYNCGNAFAAEGEHRKAIESFREALEECPVRLRRYVLYNQGNSYYQIGKFMQAHRAYEEATLYAESGNNLSLAMGNCLIYMGEFQRALRRYLEGTGPKKTPSAGHCLQNSVFARFLLNMFGNSYRPAGVMLHKHEVHFASTSVHEVGRRYVFCGNQGNAGNMPRGAGYPGLEGFEACLIPPPS